MAHQGKMGISVKDWLITHFIETQWAVLLGAGLLIVFQLKNSGKERLFKEDFEETKEPLFRKDPSKENLRLTDASSLGPHQVLGIQIDATEEQILAAYRKAAKKVHPDLGPQGDPIEQKNRKNAMIRLGVARDEMLSRLRQK